MQHEVTTAARARSEVAGTWVVAGIALVLGLVLAVWSARAGWALLYTDAQSHLVNARRITDNRSPGFVQIGTVWLPFMHLLLLPLVQWRALWLTGLAGGLIGAVATAVICGATWRTVRRLQLPPAAAVVAVATVLTCVSYLYLATAALTEPTLLACTTLMTAGLAGWLRSDKAYSGGELAVFAGIPAAAAALTRYDSWTLVVAAAAWVVWTTWRRFADWRYGVRLGLSFLSVPAVAMAWWVTFNKVRFADPLAFLRGPYSAQAQQADLANLGLLLTQGSWQRSLYAYGDVLDRFFGPLIIVTALAGLACLVTRRRMAASATLVYLLTVTAVFEVYSLYAGQTAIRTPTTTPAGYFNLRFAAPMLPLFALGVAFAYDTLAHAPLPTHVHHLRAQVGTWGRTLLPARAVRAMPGRSGLAAAAFTALFTATVLWWFPHPTTQVAVIAEGMLNQAGSAAQVAAATWLGEHYDRGGVLIDEAANPVLMPAQLNLAEYVARFAGQEYLDALDDPTTLVRWVFEQPGNNRDQVAATFAQNPSRLHGFGLVYDQDGYRIWRQVQP